MKKARKAARSAILPTGSFSPPLEQTVEELTKCFLLEFGDSRELSFGRCKGKKSFTELYDGLQSIK